MHFTPLRTSRVAGALAIACLCASSLRLAGPAGTVGMPLDSLRAHPERDPDSGAELLGRPAPEFRFARWLRTRPLTPESLRGRVVLVRFWTQECQYCRTTLPALEELRRRYADRGLVVIGAYHPHEPQTVSDDAVTRWAHELGFAGPIAVDERWHTLNHWWLDGHPDRNWVSVSFLIDRDGIVRWVHGGGEYHPSAERRHHACDLAYAGLEREIQVLLQ